MLFQFKIKFGWTWFKIYGPKVSYLEIYLKFCIFKFTWSFVYISKLIRLISSSWSRSEMMVSANKAKFRPTKNQIFLIWKTLFFAILKRLRKQVFNFYLGFLFETRNVLYVTNIRTWKPHLNSYQREIIKHLELPHITLSRKMLFKTGNF